MVYVFMTVLEEILDGLVKGELSRAQAASRIRSTLLFVDDYAKIDLNREVRVGIPEIVYCRGKTSAQVMGIVARVLEVKESIILSKVSSELLSSLSSLDHEVEKYPDAFMAVVRRKGTGKVVAECTSRPLMGLITAGTVDIPVALEAEICAREMGCDVSSHFDVGVAALFRLFTVMQELHKSDVKVIVVAAGREGALPSVVAGLTDAVVIGLPVSSGYGRGGEGEAALSGMLQACSPLLVVNIDAGVVAGVMAAKILNACSGDIRPKS